MDDGKAGSVEGQASSHSGCHVLVQRYPCTGHTPRGYHSVEDIQSSRTQLAAVQPSLFAAQSACRRLRRRCRPRPRSSAANRLCLSKERVETCYSRFNGRLTLQCQQPTTAKRMNTNDGRDLVLFALLAERLASIEVLMAPYLTVVVKRNKDIPNSSVKEQVGDKRNR